jgi:hypothetical protein
MMIESTEATMAEPLQMPEKRQGWKRRGMVLWSLSGGLMALILTASWAPDSRMTELRWVPAWLAALADRDPNIRTAAPFIPLAFLLMRGFAWRGRKWPVLWSVLVCGMCLGLSELGQVFLPHRTADVADLLWGGTGILIGVGLAGLCRFLRAQARAADQVGPADAAQGKTGGAA